LKAVEARLIDFLKKSPQFVIPIYQRTYSWNVRECRQLWDDILRTGADGGIVAHFVGSIVYIEKSLSNVVRESPLLVIDGQQRLTTITILLEMLARFLGDREPIDGFSALKLRNYFLLNSLENAERRYKLILTQTDKNTLIALLEQRPLPEEYSIRVYENSKLFEKWINESQDQIEAICKGIAKLVIVDISLDRNQDNPQLIFESLNSTGKELSQADLIRNYILMGLEPQLQTDLYEHYWRPMEIKFGQEAYAAQFDSFMRHYLTVKMGEIPNIRDVYETFKRYWRNNNVLGCGIEVLVADIETFAHYFCAMALGTEKDPELKSAFHDLRELKVEVAYPFLLELYHDYTLQILSKSDFIKIIRLVEAYVFRRSVCAIPTNSMNKTFATFISVIDKDHYLESIQAHFLLLLSYRRFPTDDEFKRDIKTKDLYNFRNRSYWLRRIENFGRKEWVSVDEYTIEHIMPQNKNLSTDWKVALGSEWERIHQIWLHTLGNLTLTGYNSEYSDKSFHQKRDMEGGFKESPLRLNRGLGTLNEWNEANIKQRADDLSEVAVLVWKAPNLNQDRLESYKPQETSGYAINDHPHLLSEPMHGVFEAFRKEVLALDPCVTEEFLKLYVAYKAETNFVDIVPQAKRLRLSLNMKFSEINDPKVICKDVSGLGRWGNGDVELGLASQDEIPYVMGLIRQAFEKQMGNSDEGL
jgi:uncharacterized protein with ParB-like and HNH nuclease domain/predicted transport protein